MGFSLVFVVRQRIAWRKKQSVRIPFGELFENFLAAKARSPKYVEQLQWTKNQLVPIHRVLACDLTVQIARRNSPRFLPTIRNAFH